MDLALGWTLALVGIYVDDDEAMEFDLDMLDEVEIGAGRFSVERAAAKESMTGVGGGVETQMNGRCRSWAGVETMLEL